MTHAWAAADAGENRADQGAQSVTAVRVTPATCGRPACISVRLAQSAKARLPHGERFRLRPASFQHRKTPFFHGKG